MHHLRGGRVRCDSWRQVNVSGKVQNLHTMDEMEQMWNIFQSFANGFLPPHESMVFRDPNWWLMCVPGTFLWTSDTVTV